ncbi:DVUA0089 family protein [Mariniblastus sp.]|nr:DVUA0089 family protein [Mariniblastus sp.]
MSKSKSKSNRKRRQQLVKRRKQSRQSLDFTELEGRRMLSGTPGPDGDSNDQICEPVAVLSNGQTIAAAIGGAQGFTDVDLFEISISSGLVGKEITFTVNAASGSNLDTYLRLFDDDGVELDNDDDGGPGVNSLIDFTFSSSGTYYLGVSSSSNEEYSVVTGEGDDTGSFSSQGPFEITFEDTNDQIDEASETLLDGFSSGNIDLETDVDVFRWDGIAGQSIRFEVDGDADEDGFGLDTYLRIFDDNGMQLDLNDDGGTGFRDSELTITFEDTNDFYIGISSASNTGYDVEDGTGDTIGQFSSTGSYTVRATEVTLDPDDTISNAIDLGNLFTQGTRSLDGRIDSDADVDLYRFEVGRNGSFVEIDLDTTVFGLNSRLRLFNSNGVQLESNIDSAAPGELAVPRESFIDRVLGPGVYFVGVSAQDNATYSATTGLGDTDGNSTGDYTLQIQDRLHVDTNEDTNTGTGGDNDDINTLREAIVFANNRSGTQTITFQSSAFPSGGDAITLSVAGSNQLEITDSVIIDGLGEDRVIVSGNDNSRVFLIDNDNDSTQIDVTIRGVTVRDGNTTGSVQVVSASEPGAGILNSENLTLENVAVRSNRSDPIVVVDSGRNGGGLFHELGELLVTGSTFSDNSANNGGGILIESGSAQIINSTFVGNTVRGGGGAILVTGGADVTIRNSTIVGNRGGDNENDDSGEFIGGIARLAGSVTLHNTLVAGNFSGTGNQINDLGGTFSSDSSHNLIGERDSGVSLNNGTNGNIVGDGNGGDLPIGSIFDQIGGAFILNENSPAVNAGSNAEAIDANGNLLTFDQFGNVRVQGGTVDIGSRESSFVDVATAPVITNIVRDEGGELARPDLINTYAVTFDQDVDVSQDDLLILNQTSGFGFFADSLSYDSSSRTATWDLGSLSLSAAFYTFQLSEDISAVAGGLSLDGDGDGFAGGFRDDEVYVAIPGDANLDGRVDVLSDAFALVANLGTNGGAVWAQGDFNGDGDVSVLGDAFLLVANLNEDVVPPATATSFASSSTAQFQSAPISSSSLVTTSALLEQDSSIDDDDDSFGDRNKTASQVESRKLALAGAHDLRDDVFGSEF